jgi:hypothetical protein
MLIGAVIAAAAGPADAFYFPGWPADGLPRTPMLYGSNTGYGPGPIQTEVFISQPPPRFVEPPDRPETPQTVPEPATLALAVLGLGAVGVCRKARGQRPA